MNDVSRDRESRSGPPKKKGGEVRPARSGLLARVVPKAVPRSYSPVSEWNNLQKDFILPPMRTDWTQAAVCFFFSTFVIPSTSTDSEAGFLQFLPDMYSRHSENILLKEALTAVSLSAFARHSRINHLNVQGRLSYGRALRLMFKALNDETAMKSDQSLTALTLLSFNELINGDEETPWISHGVAQLTLLKQDGPAQNRSPAGVHLYRMIHVRQQLVDLMNGSPPRLLSSAELQTLFPPHVMAGVFGLLRKISVVCEAARKCAQKLTLTDSENRRKVDRLVLTTEAVMKIDKETLEWSYQAKQNPEYGLVPRFPITSSSYSTLRTAFPRTVIIFRSLISATIWIQFWSGRLSLLRALEDCVTTMLSNGVPPSTLPPMNYVYESLSETVNCLCGCISYLLGDVGQDGAPRSGLEAPTMGAVLATFCLCVTGSAKNVEQAQFDWISDKLLHIGNNKELRKALILRKLLLSKRQGSW